MIKRRGFLTAIMAVVAAPSLAGYQPTKLARAIAPNNYVSVLDFGADETGRNDSSAAFQRAIYAASSGGVVYVPTGTYRVHPSIGDLT
jgi:polygalacturonase